MSKLYVAYVVPHWRPKEGESVLMGAGIMEIDSDQISDEDLKYIKEHPDDQIEIRLKKDKYKDHFYIDEMGSNKFKPSSDELHLSYDDLVPSLKAAWDKLYKHKELLFKEIFI